MRLLFILFTLVACSRSYLRIQGGVDPAFKKYVDDFEGIYHTPNHIPIHFTGGSTVLEEFSGECLTYSDGEKQILIDTHYWSQMVDSEREELIFHELGHCVFNRDHVATILSDGCPKSIMFPQVFGDVCFGLHFNAYIQELHQSL